MNRNNPVHDLGLTGWPSEPEQPELEEAAEVEALATVWLPPPAALLLAPPLAELPPAALLFLDEVPEAPAPPEERAPPEEAAPPEETDPPDATIPLRGQGAPHGTAFRDSSAV